MITAVETKVRSLKDQSLWTGVEHYELIEGEVFVGVFKNIATLEAFLDLGILEDVDESVPPYKVFPVIPPYKVFPVIPKGGSKPMALVTSLGEELPLSGGLED